MPHKLCLLERVYGRRLGRSGVCWVKCANGIPWKLDLSDPTQRWCVFGDYEGAVQMDWIRSWLRCGGVVVDSGASIGQMVMYFGKMHGVVVHAFEPTQSSRDWLSDSVGRNGFVNVEVLPYGLSNEMSTRPILLRGTHSTSRLESDPDQLVPRELVSMVRLDDFL